MDIRIRNKTLGNLIDLENNKRFEDLSNSCKVIEGDKLFVIIKNQDGSSVLDNEKINFNELIQNSVQIYKTKEQKYQGLFLLKKQKHTKHEEFYTWEGKYDPDFLGYMAEFV